MTPIGIILICASVFLVVLVIGVYNNITDTWRIIVLLACEVAIWKLGELVWQRYDISYLPIIAIAITIVPYGKKRQEVVGQLFLIFLISIIVYTGVTTVLFPNGKTSISSETSKSNEVSNEIMTMEVKPETSSNETTQMSIDDIRETKQPLKIEGYLIYYQNQFPDVRWPGGDNEESKQTLPYNGCSITSMSNVLANFGIDVSPQDITEYLNSLSYNYHKPEGGPEFEMFVKLAAHYNFSGDCIPMVPAEKIDEVVNCLEKGGMVISRQARGEFTSNGHYIAICALENDTVLVLDPNVNNRSKEKERDFRYTLSEVAEACQHWWLFYPSNVKV